MFKVVLYFQIINSVMSYGFKILKMIKIVICGHSFTFKVKCMIAYYDFDCFLENYIHE